MFQTKVVQKIKTHILRSIMFFENLAVYEIMRKNVIESGRPQTKIWRRHIACRIPKATKTLSEYVILITIPLQQSLHGCVGMLFTKPDLPSAHDMKMTPRQSKHVAG